jgi:CspA family cold shock protein
MLTGTVKWFNSTKGFGFIRPDDETKDVFVHISAVERANMKTLLEGQRLSYEIQKGRDGRASAANLTVID